MLASVGSAALPYQQHGKALFLEDAEKQFAGLISTTKQRVPKAKVLYYLCNLLYR